MRRDRARIRKLLKAGWTMTRTGSGHLKLTHPNGGVVISSSTTGDRRSIRNFNRDVRRVEDAGR